MRNDNQPGGASYKGSQSRKKRSIVGMTRRCGKAGNKEKKNKERWDRKNDRKRERNNGQVNSQFPFPLI